MISQINLLKKVKLNEYIRSKTKVNFFDNPISRFYLKFLSNKNYVSKIIIFTNYHIQKVFAYKNFVNNNSFPLLFLKKIKIDIL